MGNYSLVYIFDKDRLHNDNKQEKYSGGDIGGFFLSIFEVDHPRHATSEPN